MDEPLEARDAVEHPPAQSTTPESRVIPTIAIVAAVGLMAFLPNRVANHPRWLIDMVALLLAVVLLMASRNPDRDDRVHRRLRVASLVLTALLSLANVAAAARLIVDLGRAQGIESPTTLLLTGGAIWLTNVIVFALWYWELDRGGRIARAGHPHRDGGHDFLFPQWTVDPPFGEPEWEPTFVDYLYLAFTNATAFSPTDAMPLSRWAKLAMMAQSALSIVIVVLVVARAVNILNTPG